MRFGQPNALGNRTCLFWRVVGRWEVERERSNVWNHPLLYNARPVKQCALFPHIFVVRAPTKVCERQRAIDIRYLVCRLMRRRQSPRLIVWNQGVIVRQHSSTCARFCVSFGEERKGHYLKAAACIFLTCVFLFHVVFFCSQGRHYWGWQDFETSGQFLCGIESDERGRGLGK